MTIANLKIGKLLLDSENPRIGTADSQREAMQKLLDDGDKKMYALAESIVDEGLSPLERLLVMPESVSSDRYIALDGNRRLLALKFLSNPHVLDDLTVKPALVKRFKQLASTFGDAPDKKIPCFVVADRSKGATWIYRRHIGADQGRGVVNWTGLARARFRGSAPELQALDFVVKHGGLTPAQISEINEGFPITTLKRLIDAPDVRELIGLKRTKGVLQSGLPPDELIKPLRRIVLDLLEQEIVVTDVKLAKQQVAYVKGLDAADKPDLRKEGKARDISDILTKDFKGAVGSAAQRKRAAADPSARATVVPSRLRFNFGHENRPSAIFNELRGLRADDAPNAGAVLLRVFLELSVDYYMEKHSIPLKVNVADDGKTRWVDKKLKTKVREVVKDLANKGKNENNYKSVVRGLDSADSPFSIDLLNDYVHNRFVTPKSEHLKSAWNDSQAFFQDVWP